MTPRPSPRRAHPRALLLLVAIVSAALFAVPAAARDQIPSPVNSSVPTFISLVGHDGNGHADPLGEFTVIVRDVASNPIPGIPVDVVLAASSDLRVAVTQPFPGLTVDCGTATVTAITDASGTAVFRIVGGCTAAGGASGPGALAAKISVNGLFNVSLTACAFDRSGFDGLTPNDLAAWLTDYGTMAMYGRSDYDGSGALGANDLSRWMSVFFAGGSMQGTNTLSDGRCP